LLLARSGLDAALALPFIERGAMQLPFAVQEQIGAVSSLFRRCDNGPASLADATLIRLSEITDAPLLRTTVSHVHLHRRHGRQTSPLIRP